MSSGVKGSGEAASGSGSRVPIPSGVKKTIENIKEITGKNHTEDEIYAMLKECSMDPNETTQKLLSLDTFHEVRRKRDKRKENLNKEPAESKWKPGNQARTNRVGRGNYSSRYMSHDAGGGRNFAAVKENVAGHLSEKGTGKAPLATTKEVKKSETSSVASQISAVSNGPTDVTSQSNNAIHDNHASGGGVNQSSATVNASMSKLEGTMPLSPPIGSIKSPKAPQKKDIEQHPMLDDSTTFFPKSPAPGSYFSSSDPVLLPSQNLTAPGAVGAIRHEVGSQRAPGELTADNRAENKSASSRISTPEDGMNFRQKMPNNLQGKNQNSESLQAPSSAIGVSTSRRPSSNYNNRPQVIGPQKVGSGKEWKPKSSNPSIGQDTTVAALSGSSPESRTTPDVASKEATVELQRKLEESHISDGQHVIIPNHLHVPEIEKLGFYFGSFDASFGLEMNQSSVTESDKSPPVSESSEAIEESVKDPQLSNHASEATEATEEKYPEHPQSPSQVPEDFSSTEVEVSSSTNPDHGESKEEAAPGSHQHPVVNTASNYNFGFMPPILSGQLPLESSESQTRDAPRLPGFVVQQPFDPASYYAQFYRPGMDSDGRISPFHSAGAANKYNGNAALVSAQTSQTLQELQAGVPLVLSAASPTPLVTQPVGVMQNSITAAQQPLPVFRQPTGVHLPPYNYIPYGPYFSPFYIPPPAIHQFLNNGAAFPQQPQAGSLYPTPPGMTAKYSPSQYKQQGSNTGSSTHIGVPGSYGPYGISMANYSTSSASAAVTPTSNEDLAASQAKENNICVSGQQNEGSGVWFTTHGRDISTMQPSSFYNLPQGQVAFTPTQPGHGTFPGIFHPAQAVTAATMHPLLHQSQPITSPGDMVGPTGNVYQQPQHAQLNWPSNY